MPRDAQRQKTNKKATQLRTPVSKTWCGGRGGAGGGGGPKRRHSLGVQKPKKTKTKQNSAHLKSESNDGCQQGMGVIGSRSAFGLQDGSLQGMGVSRGWV